ncbi:Vang protein 1, partial [Fasciola gigantica]
IFLITWYFDRTFNLIACISLSIAAINDLSFGSQVMDVESVRSNRSERSDRSRKSKRIQLPIHSLSQIHTSDGQLRQLHTGRGTTSSTPVDLIMMQNTDLNLRPMTPSSLAVTQSMQQQQRPQGPSYSMYNWMPPPSGMTVGPSFTAYPQPTPYSPMVWNGQQQQQSLVPVSYPHQVGTFPGPGMPLPNPQQPVQPMCHPGFVPSVQQLYAPTPQMGSTSSNTQSPPHTESYRPESSQLPPTVPTQPQVVATPTPAPQSYETHISHGGHNDDTAWVEEATAVTGATSETGLSGGDNLSRFGARFGLAASLGLQPGTGYGISGAAAALIRTEADEINVYSCSHVIGLLASTLVALGALVSPVFMLLLPHFPMQIGWDTETCQSTCEGHLIGISVKLLLLSLATWVLSAPCRALCAGGTAILPRVRLCRTLFLCLVFVVLFAFWLFYTVRVIQPKEPEYLSIVLFADSLTDTLLFLHYAGIGLMELRKTRHRYAIHIVRSPDGMSKTLKCGEMSLQRAALEVLQFYMIEFTALTPGQTGSGNVSGGKRGRRSGVEVGSAPSEPGSNTGGGSRYKFYDVDGSGTGLIDKAGSGVGYSSTMRPANGAVTTAVQSASARLYEELELEKRTRKRRMRLLLAVEEAFTHVRRLASETCASGSAGQTSMPLNPQANGLMFKTKLNQEKSLDPYEAAQAVFPTLIRPLQKYMRVTRQQARHPVDMVIDHLALCLAYGLSPHAFLERFNPAAATPQLDAAAAATAIRTAKRDRKQQQQQQQQVHQRSGRPGQPGAIDNGGPFLPKHVYPGGQQTWSIVADRALSRSLADGAIFQLRRGSEISLLCTVRRLPLIRLIEEVLEPLEVGRFALNTDNAV